MMEVMMQEEKKAELLPEQLQGKFNAAKAMIADLNHGRREWGMSIPARRDVDPDLVISDALHDLKASLLSDREQIAEAQCLLKALVESREFLLYIGDDSTYGKRVRKFLDGRR